MSEEKNLKEIIKTFIKKWDNTSGMWRNEFIENLKRQYRGYSIKISFGNSGNRIKLPKHPWMTFLKYNNKTSKGVYPIIIYNYEKDNLEVGLGISETETPDIEKSKIREIENFERKFFDKDDLESMIRYLNDSIDKFEKIIKTNNIKTDNIKNIILYGSPGVGKTHSYQKLIAMIEDGKNQKDIFDFIKSSENIEQNNEIYQEVKNEKRVEFVTFHQSYSYEDFIEGFRPKKDGSIKLEDGIFKKLCQEVGKNKEQNYYIIIDEINRGNISKIFGELITLIEEDKRDRLEITLPYSKEPFKIPSNLYIIATMNTTDKSIATIDIALRRRFTFIKMSPNPELITKNLKAKTLMMKLNEYIKENLSEDYMLGHSYFMKVEKDEDLEFVKEYKLKPLLEEYFYADSEKLKEVMEKLN